MQRLVYILSYPVLWFVAILPFRLFYAISDIVFLMLFYLIGYRRKVVRDNLKLVFPEFSETDIRRTEKKFYSHMCDVFLETIKTMKISKNALNQRYRIVNPEVLREMESKNSVMVLIPHYGNWEWSIAVNDILQTKGYAVYQKIGNKYFDALIKRIRARWNTTLIHQKEMVRTILRNLEDEIDAVYGIVSDQSPMRHRTKYWRPFMGIKVPVFDSPEIIARKFDLAVAYAKIEKLKRGHYQIEFIPICSNGKLTSENEITDRFIELTEESIRVNPAYYLWTHRRWKHREKGVEKTTS